MITDPRQLAQEALALDTAAQDAHPSTPVGALAQLERLGRLYDMCQPLATALLAALDERDAYRKAKQENDERFMLERDEARRERDELRLTLAAEQGRAEGAPSGGWEWDSHAREWWKNSPVGRITVSALGGRADLHGWAVDYPGQQVAMHRPTARAALLAADAATVKP